MRRISTSNGCRSFKSVDCGLRPRASETLLLPPANFPFGEDHGSSANWLELIFSIAVVGRGAVCFEFQSAVATGNDERFTRDPGRIAGGQENYRARDVPRLANAAERRLRFDLLAHLALRNA